MGIFAINALLLQKAASFPQLKCTSISTRYNNLSHSIGRRPSDLTTVQWLPSNTDNVVRTSGESTRTIVTNSNVCVSASSNSRIEECTVRPDAEKISSTILRSLRKLCGSGSDIRGRFVDHDDSIHSFVVAIQESEAVSNQPALTPFAAYCIGYSYANAIVESLSSSSKGTICIGVDPRTHGIRLAEAFACGASAYLKSDSRNHCSISLVFTGSATTPACASFVRSQQCDGAVVSSIFDE